MTQALLRISSDISAPSHPDAEVRTSNLKEVLSDIQGFVPEEKPPPVADPVAELSSGHPVSGGLMTVSEEFDNLATELRNCPVASGADKLSLLALSGRDAIRSARDTINSAEKSKQ